MRRRGTRAMVDVNAAMSAPPSMLPDGLHAVRELTAERITLARMRGHSGTCPHIQLEGKFNNMLKFFAVQHVQHHAGRSGAEVICGETDAGQRRAGQGSEGYVVTADDRDVAGDVQARFPEGLQRAEGGVVVEGDDRVEHDTRCQCLRNGIVAVGAREPRVPDELRVAVEPEPADGGPVSGETLPCDEPIRLSGDTEDMPAPGGRKVFHGASDGSRVVYADRGDVENVRADRDYCGPCPVPAAQMLLLVEAATAEDDAVDPLVAEQVEARLLLGGQPVGVAEDHHVASGLRHVFHAAR